MARDFFRGSWGPQVDTAITVAGGPSSPPGEESRGGIGRREDMGVMRVEVASEEREWAVFKG